MFTTGKLGEGLVGHTKGGVLTQKINNAKTIIIIVCARPVLEPLVYYNGTKQSKAISPPSGILKTLNPSLPDEGSGSGCHRLHWCAFPSPQSTVEQIAAMQIRSWMR